MMNKKFPTKKRSVEPPKDPNMPKSVPDIGKETRRKEKEEKKGSERIKKEKE